MAKNTVAGPFLVVELPDSAASQRDVAALVQACSTALRPVRCGLQRDAAGQTIAAVAVVSFRRAGRPRALIQVGRRSEQGGPEWLSEQLTFRLEDASVEQFRSMGLTIAVLYRELSLPGEPPAATAPDQGKHSALDTSKSEPPGRATAAKDSPVVPNERDEMRLDSSQPSGGPEREASMSSAWIAAGGLVGSDPGLGSVRVGGAASLTYVPMRPLNISVSGRYLRASADSVSLGWATISVGGGAAVPAGPEVELRGRVNFLVENVFAQAQDASSGRTERSAAWIEGAGAELQAAWLPGRVWGVALGLSVERLARWATVRLYDHEVGTTSRWSYCLGLDLELHPFARTRPEE